MNFEIYTPEQYDTLLSYIISEPNMMIAPAHTPEEVLNNIGENINEVNVWGMCLDLVNYDDSVLRKHSKSDHYFIAGTLASGLLKNGGFSEIVRKEKERQGREQEERQAEHGAHLATIEGPKLSKNALLVSSIAVLIALMSWLFPKEKSTDIKPLQDSLSHQQKDIDSLRNSMNQMNNVINKMQNDKNKIHNDSQPKMSKK